MELEIRCGYEGANPQGEEYVTRLGEGAVRVCPQSEDGDSNYKFAFDITVENNSDDLRILTLHVDWQEPPEVGTKYMGGRESVFLLSGAELQEIDGVLDGDKVHFELELPPGTSRICMHPPFGTSDLEAFFARAAALPGAGRVCFGQTAEGRPLEAAVLPAAGGHDLCLLAVGRFHPYETAGSHAVAGVLELLAGPEGEKLRRSTTFVLAPVVNPDGAAHGLCKRTPTGVNLTTDGNGSDDPTACSLRGLLAGVASASARAALLDFHGWMISQDGLYVHRKGIGEKMQGLLAGDLFPNGWRLTDVSGATPDPSTTDLRRYAAWVLGMEVVVTSHPWFGRGPAVMRRVGAATTRAFLDVLG